MNYAMKFKENIQNSYKIITDVNIKKMGVHSFYLFRN